MKYLPIFFCVLLPFQAVADPTVTNIRAAQRAGTKLVDVYYDLSGADGPATVAVAVSDNGGSSYAVPATSLSGAVGGGVSNGTNKHVVWNAGIDWNQQFSAAVKFRITATIPPPPVPDGFALIPAGSFTMGRTSGDTDSNAPPVSVYVSAFYMAKHEVTKALWDEVRTWGLTNGYSDLPTGSGKAANHPVHTIAWHAMVKWCNARSEKEGLTPVYCTTDSQSAIYRTGIVDLMNSHVKWDANGFRLPTEAEWEKASRGGLDELRYPWGSDTISHLQANYFAVGVSYGNQSGDGGYHPTYDIGLLPYTSYTSPVGSFTSNNFDLYDMAGNVLEWCWDRYSANYYSNGANNPLGPTSGSFRVGRGGSWSNNQSSSRCASRYSSTQGVANNNVGFRLTRSLAP